MDFSFNSPQAAPEVADLRDFRVAPPDHEAQTGDLVETSIRQDYVQSLVDFGHAVVNSHGTLAPKGYLWVCPSWIQHCVRQRHVYEALAAMRQRPAYRRILTRKAP